MCFPVKHVTVALWPGKHDEVDLRKEGLPPCNKMQVNSQHVLSSHSLNIGRNWVMSLIFLSILLNSVFQVWEMAALQQVELVEEQECSSASFQIL